MIHGGCGLISNPEVYKESIISILKEGEEMLKIGKSALDVVEYCVRMLEDNPLFNAGKGSVLNANGTIDLDAAIMDGSTLKAGAVAGVKNIKNPVSLARAVMEHTPHVMLIGDGAMEFAKTEKIELLPDEYFITEKRVTQLKEAKEKNQVVLDHSSMEVKNNKLGTVGAVARDISGNLAAATSTGGIVNKQFGRIGDSPIVGAGVFADNETCAVSATGFGEQFIRTVLSKTISDLILFKNMNAEQAAKEGINYLVKKVNGLGGVIVIDRNGECSNAFSTETMICGRVTQDIGSMCLF